MPGPSLNVNTIVRAGAGAGKTTRLIKTIFDFCAEFKEKNSRFPRLIVCTFTRKATKELRERLMQKALLSGDWDFVRFVASNQLHISTIHGVLLKYLSHFGYRLGLDPRFRFVDGAQVMHTAKDIVRSVLNSESLTPDQRAHILETFEIKGLAELAIKSFEFSGLFPHLKMHGEESLKNLLSEEIISVIAELSRLREGLEKYVGERPIIGEVSQWLNKQTKVLKNYADEQIKLQDVLTSLATLPKFQISAKKPFPSDDLLGKVREVIKEIRASWDTPAYDFQSFYQVGQTLSAAEECIKLFREKFLAHKLNTGELEISDLEVLSMELLRKHPETMGLFSLDWDFWMIDEYQDTSPIQVELINKLKGKSASFVVGDPQQSIYLFRGARSEVFIAGEKAVRDSNGLHDVLDVNHRSRPELVAFFNEVFVRDGNKFFTAKASKPAGAAKLADVRLLMSDRDESGYIPLIAEVNLLVESGIAPENIAILARQKKSLKQAAKALMDAKIPCLMHSAGAFYERREILDALSLLRFLLNPHDNTNFIDLIRSPWFKVEDLKILESLANKKCFSFWSEVMSQPLFEPLNKLLLERDRFSITEVFRRALIDNGFFDFSHYLDLSGRREANLWKLVNDLEQAARQPGFNFLNFAQQKLRELNLDYSEDEDATAAKQGNRVNLMTVHQSKGLQFEHVIVLDIDKAIKSGGHRGRMGSFDEEKGFVSFPIYNRSTAKNERTLGDITCQNAMRVRELEESARVFYVAVTRAINGLTIIGGLEPKEDSWQRLIPFNFESGEHSGNGYCYVVEYGPWTKSDFKVPSAEIVKNISPVTLPETSMFEKISVTNLVKGSRQNKERPKVLLKSLQNSIQTSRRGVLMHQLLESVKYQGIDAGLTMAESYFPETPNEARAALNWVFELKDPDMKQILETGFAEWGFQFRHGSQIIDGQIDLWGRANAKVWILDYKTGSSVYADRAFSQLTWYAKALRAYGITDKIQMAVMYPFEKSFVTQTYTENF